MGTFAKDTHESASQAALVGGTTTFIEMICPGRTEKPLEAFELWLGKAQGKSACDFTFHMGVTRYDARRSGISRDRQTGREQLQDLSGLQGRLGVTDEELYKTLRLARRTGGHHHRPLRERGSDPGTAKAKLLAEGKTGPEYHYWSRPPRGRGRRSASPDDVRRDDRRACLYRASELRGGAGGGHARVGAAACSVWVETLIQYLLCDKTDAEKPDFEGAKFVMSPPLREKRNQEALWNGLRKGFVSTLATDHAPFDFKRQKQMGRNDFTKIPNGIPSLEDRINLYFTYGVKRGRIDLHQFVNTASTQAAKIFGLVPAQRRPSSPARTPTWWFTIRPTTEKSPPRTHRMNLDYNAFEGMEIEGRPHVVTVRGKVAARNGKFVGEAGRGQFLRREPNHF